MTTDYQKQATDFLASHNLEFRAVLVGDDCPRFCPDAEKMRAMDKVNVFPRKSHIHGKHYRCTISGKERGHVTFDFWNSYADEEFNALGTQKYRNGESVLKYGTNRKKTVTPYDLLACIEKSDPGDFEEFCGNYGYDADSRKAEDTWRAVIKEWKKVERFFTAAELAEIQEIS